MSAFPHLFRPIDVGSIRLANRIVMGSMHTRLETLDRPLERVARFYVERAKGGAALIITGGFSPNAEGLMEPGSPLFDSPEQLGEHRPITRAVHDAGGRIALQILHAGRYARVDGRGRPVDHRLAHQPERAAPHDRGRHPAHHRGLRHHGGAGPRGRLRRRGDHGQRGLSHQRVHGAPHQRPRDDWGGSLENRLRLPVAVMARVRERVGRDFLVIFRVSSIDLVEGGLTAEEIAAEARAVEAAGADVINQGIGWHEARVPTIAQKVPRAAWTFAARLLKDAVRIPVIASNRINTPEVAEAMLARGDADLVSMARPMLADAEFANKAREGRADEINVCIACNQACLDLIFSKRVATCLVNPKAGREIEFDAPPPAKRQAHRRGRRRAGGPRLRGDGRRARAQGDALRGGRAHRRPAQPGAQRAGQGGVRRDACATIAPASRASASICNSASARTAEALAAGGFDEIVVATGVTPRLPAIPGIDHASCASYVDILNGTRTAGRRVAIMGAGGIGFDIAEFLTSAPQEVAASAGALPRRVGRRCRHREPRRARRPLPLVGEGQGGGIAEPPAGFPHP